MPHLQASTCKCLHESSHSTASMCAPHNLCTTIDIITITAIGNKASIHVIADVIKRVVKNKTHM